MKRVSNAQLQWQVVQIVGIGLLMSFYLDSDSSTDRSPNIRTENCEPESKPVFHLTLASQTVVHGLATSASHGSWSDVR